MKRAVALLLFLACLITLSVTAFAEADKGDLTALLNENYNPSLYTSDSYQAYQSAVTYAFSIYENEYATQEEVNAAVSNMKEKKDRLVPVLNREMLLSYVTTLELYLYAPDIVLSEEMETILTAARNEFLELYNKPDLTQDLLSAADVKYTNLMEQTEAIPGINRFSSKDAPEGIVIPDKVFSSAQGLGKVTAIRLVLIGIGAGLILVGLVVSVIYLKPKKSRE